MSGFSGFGPGGTHIGRPVIGGHTISCDGSGCGRGVSGFASEALAILITVTPANNAVAANLRTFILLTSIY